MLSDPAMLSGVAIGSLALGAAAMKVAQTALKERKGGADKKDDLEARVLMSIMLRIGSLFDERMRIFMEAQERENERFIGDIRRLFELREDRIIPLVGNLKDVVGQQVEILTRFDRILTELVTVSRMKQPSGGS